MLRQRSFANVNGVERGMLNAEATPHACSFALCAVLRQSWEQRWRDAAVSGADGEEAATAAASRRLS